ncbi:MAG: tetratricopeptide repeat protein, partial [Verrucomicrobia bacterium]|nr:tetratricopeptide repeat protein [Verrucomicrobiota bacterium]
MKQWFALLVLMLVIGRLPAVAQSADEQYVGIYNLIQQGDAFAATQPTEALPKYLAAQTALQRLQKLNPDWNPKVVNFRLTYLADKIAELPSAKPRPTTPVFAPSPPAPPKPAAAVPGATVESKPALPPPAPTAETKRAAAPEAEQQIRALQDDVRRLQTEKAILEAKVREALATQPAAIDPRELAKAQDKIQSLLKENELLKASAGPAPAQPTPTADTKGLDEAKLALGEANRKLVEQTARASSLDAEKATLQKRLAGLVADTEGTNSPANLRQALEEANRKLAEQVAATRQLASEQEALQQRVSKLSVSAEAADTLRAENEVLKQQLAQAKAPAPPAGPGGESSGRTTETESRLAALQSDAEVLRLEKTALEDRLKTAATASAKATATRETDLQRIKQLEAERDAAQQQLAAATKETPLAANQELTAKVEKLTQEIAGLRARLNVFEARAVPYSVEELVLFKQSEPRPIAADSVAGKKLTQQLPPGTTSLAAEAQRHFAAREFDQAASKYQDILRQDDKNSVALANLARVQIESKRFDEAEKNIRLALVAAPNDAYSLFILGYLKLQQEKYEEALDPLSRAAQLNPGSAEIQNCLGVALSHQ